MIWTVGHGNRTIGELLALLEEARIECLVDVRSYPGSRRHPQFARAALAQSLAAAAIGYVWEGAALGGRRRPAKDSPHLALRSAGFRGYADHMASAEFRAGLARLVERSRAERTAILCAERLPWRCPRFLLSDALVARGMPVEHLIGLGQRQPHALSALARERDGALVYDAAQTELDL